MRPNVIAARYTISDGDDVDVQPRGVGERCEIVGGGRQDHVAIRGERGPDRATYHDATHVALQSYKGSAA
jgi:hypothetical protein